MWGRDGGESGTRPLTSDAVASRVITYKMPRLDEYAAELVCHAEKGFTRSVRVTLLPSLCGQHTRRPSYTITTLGSSGTVNSSSTKQHT